MNRLNTPPAKCGGPSGATAAVAAAVNLLSPEMHFPQSLKMTAGFDHRFGSSTPLLGSIMEGIVGTLEVLYTKGLYTPFYQNLALIEPAATNRNFQGRLMYGTISGRARGRLPLTVSANLAMWAGVVPQHPPTMLTHP